MCSKKFSNFLDQKVKEIQIAKQMGANASALLQQVIDVMMQQVNWNIQSKLILGHNSDRVMIGVEEDVWEPDENSPDGLRVTIKTNAVAIKKSDLAHAMHQAFLKIVKGNTRKQYGRTEVAGGSNRVSVTLGYANESGVAATTLYIFVDHTDDPDEWTESRSILSSEHVCNSAHILPGSIWYDDLMRTMAETAERNANTGSELLDPFMQLLLRLNKKDIFCM